MSPSELWDYCEVNQKYKLKIFRPRIYQEIRQQKYFNYLDHKRQEKRREYQEEKNGDAVTFKRNKIS